MKPIKFAAIFFTLLCMVSCSDGMNPFEGHTSDGSSLADAAKDADTVGPNPTTDEGEAAADVPTCNPCSIFISDTAYKGNLGGIAGADAKCNSSSNKPVNNVTYRALIASSTRYPGSKDWPIHKGNFYNGELGMVGWANASHAIPFPFVNAIVINLGPEKYAWTGLRDDWRAWEDNNCNDWTSIVEEDYGAFGNGYVKTKTFLNSAGGGTCSEPFYLYCVQVTPAPAQ